MDTSNSARTQPQAGDERLAVLQRYNIVDTPPESSFDEIVALAAMLCRAPAAAIIFVERDRQWTKASFGIDTLAVPIERSICARTIRQADVLIFKEADEARRVIGPSGALPPPHRFYAGAPIETPDGHRIGTLCILDLKPRDLGEDEKAVLRMLARRAMTELELRRAREKERSARLDAARIFKEKQESLIRHDILVREIDHRVKNSLQLVASMLALQARGLSDMSAVRSLKDAQQRIGGIAAIHEQLYRVSGTDQVDLREFLEGLCGSLATSRPDRVGRLAVEVEPVVVSSTRAMKVGLLVNELVTNAFKHAYGAGQRGDVVVRLAADGDIYRLVVRDSGVGLPRGLCADASPGLGIRLISAIVEQVRGALTLGDGGGTAIAIDIPFEQPPEPAVLPSDFGRRAPEPLGD